MSEQEEFSAAVARHATWLSAFLRGLTRSEADAEDSFQEVWLRVFRGGGLGRVAAERAFLARVARTVVIDRYRREARYVHSLDVVDDTGQTEAESLPDETPGPSEKVEKTATHEDVLQAVRRLAPGPRQVVLLRIEGELTFQEIADELKVPLNTVLTWMRRATQVLKHTLGE